MAALALMGLTAASASAQNRYGAERDLGYEVYSLKRDLEATNGRLNKLEDDVKAMKGSGGGGSDSYVSYRGGGSQEPISRRSSDGTYHRVQGGETLSSISRRYQIGVDRLVAENRITNPNALRIGQEIFIPGRKGSVASTPPAALPVDSPAPSGGAKGGTHVVRPGETLSSIARRHGVTATAIASANGLRNPDAIAVGQSLTIPGSSSHSSGGGSRPPANPAPAPDPAPQPKSGGNADEVVAPEGYGFYQVEPGDTLHSIAISFGTNTRELRRLNELPGDKLHVGDFLLVPVPDDSLYES